MFLRCEIDDEVMGGMCWLLLQTSVSVCVDGCRGGCGCWCVCVCDINIIVHVRVILLTNE